VGRDVDGVAVRRLIATPGAAFSSAAFGFHDATGGASNAAWGAPTWLVAVLALAAILYATGVARLWARAGPGRGLRWREVASFALGGLALAAALASPLDAWAAHSFALHMTQHELLMVVAAPLLVLGRPLRAWTWALPELARAMRGAAAAAPGLRSAWRTVSAPATAWGVHAIALWLWHLPVLFVAAAASLGLHVLQHTSFFASALLFWASVFPGRARARGALPVASLFTTMLHTGALGALLTFAPSPWYGTTSDPLLGLSALEDQQLGGLVMWLPGSIPYLAATLAIVAAWMAPGTRPRLHANG
jgi:cytochrome c oxidase assembly factor CtaG